jgi:hypothetical protein
MGVAAIVSITAPPAMQDDGRLGGGHIPSKVHWRPLLVGRV